MPCSFTDVPGYSILTFDWCEMYQCKSPRLSSFSHIDNLNFFTFLFFALFVALKRHSCRFIQRYYYFSLLCHWFSINYRHSITWSSIISLWISSNDLWSAKMFNMPSGFPCQPFMLIFMVMCRLMVVKCLKWQSQVYYPSN